MVDLIGVCICLWRVSCNPPSLGTQRAYQSTAWGPDILLRCDGGVVVVAVEILDFPGGTLGDIGRIIVGNVNGRAS